MPDTRKHRGAHPSDAKLFAPAQIPTLQIAVEELAWLLSRNYAVTSALKLVGDHHGLNKRQRVALSRATCADQYRATRQAKCQPAADMAGEVVMIDGFNLLITVEAALGGGVILRCRDGCLRDVASVHGTYRNVEETHRALRLIGEALDRFQPRTVCWLFDQPVSNSGRMAATVRREAEERGWPWQADVVLNPDTELMASPHLIVSSDSAVLDHAARWINLAATIIPQFLPEAWLVDLQGGGLTKLLKRRRLSP